jgi:hypothetical protein
MVRADCKKKRYSASIQPILEISDSNLLIRYLFTFEPEIAGVAQFLAINYSSISAFTTNLIMIYCRV